MAVIKGITVYIPLYDKWGNSIGQIELEPRLVDGLPKQGSRKGELIFNTQDSSLYFWDGEQWRGLGAATTAITRDDVVDFWATPFWDNIPDKPSEFPPEPHTHPRSDITDFWATPFWDNIPDKPSEFPPEPHTHPRSDITDFFNSPFWDNIPDKPDKFPPESHTHDAGDIVSGTLDLARLPPIPASKLDFSTWEKVAEVEVNSDTDYVEFTGLNINADKVYVMFFTIKNMVARSYYNVFVEGNTDESDYACMYISTDGNSLSTVGSASSYVGYADYGTICQSLVVVTLDSSPRFKYLSLHSDLTRLFVVAGKSDFTVDNITTLRIQATESNAIGAGSKFILCKVRTK